MNPDSRANVCVFFTHGECITGDSCTFSHVIEGASPNSAAASRNRTQPVPSDATAQYKLTTPTPCVFWKKGRCKKGNECKFAHFKKTAIRAGSSSSSLAPNSVSSSNTSFADPGDPSAAPSVETSQQTSVEVPSTENEQPFLAENSTLSGDLVEDAMNEEQRSIEQRGYRTPDTDPDTHLDPDSAKDIVQEQYGGDYVEEPERYQIENDSDESTSLPHGSSPFQQPFDLNEWQEAKNEAIQGPVTLEAPSDVQVPMINQQSNLDVNQSDYDDQQLSALSATLDNENSAEEWSSPIVQGDTECDRSFDTVIPQGRADEHGRAEQNQPAKLVDIPSGSQDPYEPLEMDIEKESSPTDKEDAVIGYHNGTVFNGQYELDILTGQDVNDGPNPAEEPISVQIPHWTEYADPSANPFVAFCKFYARGQCIQGPLCAYRHALTIQEYLLLFRIEPSIWSPYAGFQANQVPASVQTSSNDTCKFYPLGRCRNGDKCPYVHIEPPDSHVNQGPEAQNGPEFDGRQMRAGDDWSNRKTQPCKWFTRSGSCRKGDTCIYSHEGGGEWGSSTGTQDDSQGWTSESWDDQEAMAPEHSMTSQWDGNNTWEEMGNRAGDMSDWNINDEKINEMQVLESNETTVQDDGWGASWDEPSNANLGDASHSESAQVETMPSLQDVSGSSWDNANEGDASWDQKEDSWKVSWPEARPDTSATLKHQKRPCKFFGQGYCRKGNSCNLLHIQSDGLIVNMEPEVSNLQPQTDDADSHQQEVIYDEDTPALRPLFNSVIVFGAGCHVQQVLTPTDPNQIILSGIASDITQGELENLLPSTSGITKVVLSPADASNAILEFVSQHHTLQAFQSLTGYELHGSTLSASLNTTLAVGLEEVVQNCKVRVTWPAPSKIAWARYSSVALAKEDATRLDGQVFSGHKVKASYLPSKRGQTGLFTVQISNLPVNEDQTSVMQKCKGCQLVNMTKPTYTESPVENIRHMLSQHGELISFQVLEPPSRQTSVAIAKFEHPESAASAVQSMKKLMPDFLGGENTLQVEHINFTQFHIKAEYIQCIQSGLEKLDRDHWEHCSILVIPSLTGITIYVHAPIDNTSVFVKVLASVNALVQGEALKHNGSIVWNDYFNTPSSTKVIETLNIENSRDYNTLIVPDHYHQQILIFGDKLNQGHAKDSILKVLKKVDVAQNDIPFERVFVQWYLEQGLALIQSDPKVGRNKVSIDVTEPKLIIKGEPKRIYTKPLVTSVISAYKSLSHQSNYLATTTIVENV
ncbi:hypothetical protein AX17_003587 [Amanita inopinata Kibby_2008]|nr:hypothetical protein AX17_003587 [Amanita inopinata Kibby_2008]